MQKEKQNLESWKIWATNMKMLRDIHEEIDGKIEKHNNLIYSDEPHKLMTQENNDE